MPRQESNLQRRRSERRLRTGTECSAMAVSTGVAPATSALTRRRLHGFGLETRRIADWGFRIADWPDAGRLLLQSAVRNRQSAMELAGRRGVAPRRVALETSLTLGRGPSSCFMPDASCSLMLDASCLMLLHWSALRESHPRHRFGKPALCC